MKAILKFVMIGLASGVGLGTFAARADLEVSAGVSIHAAADFYAPLASRGAWIEVGSYGRCWRPALVAAGWRPYCNGHWVWTDCGWYWASDEPWAWACYHYGWWVYDPVVGWVWVPGIEWAPAWVSWRVGGGYIGWAPLAPRGVKVAGPLFVFVKAARFQSPVRLSTVTVNNPTVLNQTTVANNIKRETRNIGAGRPQKVVINEGPGLAVIQQASGRTIKAIPIREAARQVKTPAGFSRAHPTGSSKSEGKPKFGPAEEPKFSPDQQAPPPGAEKPPPIERPAWSPHGSANRPGPGPRPSEGEGESEGHDQEGGHHGKD